MVPSVPQYLCCCIWCATTCGIWIFQFLFANHHALADQGLLSLLNLLPMMLSCSIQYMGALTHSRLDRAVIARYFAFLVVSQLIIFTLIGVIFSESMFAMSTSMILITFLDSVQEVVILIGRRASFSEIISNLHRLYC